MYKNDKIATISLKLTTKLRLKKFWDDHCKYELRSYDKLINSLLTFVEETLEKEDSKS